MAFLNYYIDESNDQNDQFNSFKINDDPFKVQILLPSINRRGDIDTTSSGYYLIDDINKRADSTIGSSGNHER